MEIKYAMVAITIKWEQTQKMVLLSVMGPKINEKSQR